MNLIDRRLVQSFHWGLLLLTLVLGGVGIAVLFSTTYVPGLVTKHLLYQKQFYWLLIGSGVMILSVSLDYRKLEHYAYPIFIISLLLIGAVLVTGKTISGARRWISIGGFTFQPSELIKLTFILALGKYIHNSRVEGGYTLRTLVGPTALLLVPFAGILLEPDLGTAMILLFIFLSIILFLKIRRSTLIAIVVLSLVTAPIGWASLKDYQKERIMTFLNQEEDPHGQGWHINQSKIAIGSGKFWGKGYMKGTQSRLQFLPEKHTDFIFSVIAEEWGFAGAVSLLLLYFLLIYWGVQVALNAKETFGAVLAIGVISMLFWHIVINIGMTLGMLPVVGVPLPFLSYGGTFLVITMAGIGLLINVSVRRFMF